MRVLNALLGRSLVIAAVVLTLTVTSTPSLGHPGNETDHGVNATTYHLLWTGDDDARNVSIPQNRTEMLSSGSAALAAGTDVPLDTPPAAVGRWNQGDLDDFPTGNASRSVHPSDATLHDGSYIRDAYAAVFAVSPSTRAHLSPSDKPLYIASNGTVLGTVDFRVVLPDNETSVTRRVSWSLESAEVSETRLFIDHEVIAIGSGEHTPELGYGFDGRVDETHVMTLQAEIKVVLRERIEVCTDRSGTSCNDWDVSIEKDRETLSVSDSIRVVVYDLAISGFRTTYPNGDRGLVVYKNQPWLGYSLPGGDVRGVWRFYVARDETWDTLVTRSATEETRNHSPLHPLQVHAYPIEAGPTPSPRYRVSIIQTYGRETAPPVLPADVHLDVVDEPYTASYGIATRTRTPLENLTGVTALGLVRGVEAEASSMPFTTVPINRSELSLTVLETTDETVTVRARLKDARTGDPINTADRDGYVILHGQEVDTSDNGTVTITVERPPGGVSARYHPSQWWHDVPGYAGDSDAVSVPSTPLDLLSVLYGLGISLALFSMSVFLIDRITGWRIWPPWRGW